MRTLFRALIALAPVLGLSVAACSDNNPTGDAGPGQQLCPSNILQATAAPGEEGTTSACHVENYTCVVGYPCGNFQQQATCVCQTVNGVQAFVCAKNSDPNRTPIAALDPTTDAVCALPPGPTNVCSLCVSTSQDGGEPCPTDKTTADGTACSTTGEICSYTTTCTTQPPPIDTCQCVANPSGDAGLSWQCDLHQCP
jgi:hypothetical protein